jgi:GMP synthase-like glutamine amidotransferase
VCFGHQLLAHALGGVVEKAEFGWGAGIRPLDIVRAEPWMHPPLERCQLHFMHQDQVTKAPEHAVVLGCSDHCEVAMFRVGTMLGLQAHPEFTVAYARALLSDRVERIGGERAGEALASLDKPTDEAVVAHWLAAFFGGTEA